LCFSFVVLEYRPCPTVRYFWPVLGLFFCFQMASIPLLSVTEEPPEQKENLSDKNSNRRADIDVIRVGLTWGILLFHNILVYSPYDPYTIKDPFVYTSNLTAPSIGSKVGEVVTKFMDCWQMPMFFLLSGMSVFYAMNRRSRSEFHMERFHRLLVPCLFLMAVTQLAFATNYVAKLGGRCLAWRAGLTRTSNGCKMFFPVGPNDTAATYIQSFWKGYERPGPHQGWFLAYLFIYSQILGLWFYNWHPTSSSSSSSTSLSSILSKLEQCIINYSCFFGKWSRTSHEFANSAAFFLNGPKKLALCPSLIIAVIEMTLRAYFPQGRMWFFGAFTDVANTLHYGFVYFIGFALAAIEDRGVEASMTKFGWIYLIIGIIETFVYISTFAIVEIEPVKSAVAAFPWLFTRVFRGLFRGFGEWMILIGVIGVSQRHIHRYPTILKTLVQMAMPFYVTHEQVMAMIGVGILRVPILHNFPFLLLFSTLGTSALSYLIVKSGPLRYFFGLPTSKGSILPGKALRGLIPGIFLAIVVTVETIVGNTV
jgi:hypothetical protein